MCEACDAAAARHEAATTLRRKMTALTLGDALSVVIPVEAEVPLEMEALVAALDRRQR